MLEEEVAVVTGSTGGIGEAVAHQLASDGARVIVTGRRGEEGERVAADIVAARWHRTVRASRSHRRR